MKNTVALTSLAVAKRELENAGNQIASLCSSLEFVKEGIDKIDLLLENAVEIGQIAAYLEKKDKIVIDDGKELSMFCVDLAKQFEQQFNPDEGDYYIDIDEFTSQKLIEKFGAPEKPQPMHEKTIYNLTMHQTCYVPENADSMDDCYTHSALLALVHGDENLCRQLFDALKWRHPETVIDENLRDGIWGKCEKCGRYYDITDESMTECPHCHALLPGDEHFDVAVDRELGYKWD